MPSSTEMRSPTSRMMIEMGTSSASATDARISLELPSARARPRSGSRARHSRGSRPDGGCGPSAGGSHEALRRSLDEPGSLWAPSSLLIPPLSGWTTVQHRMSANLIPCAVEWVGIAECNRAETRSVPAAATHQSSSRHRASAAAATASARICSRVPPSSSDVDARAGGRRRPRCGPCRRLSVLRIGPATPVVDDADVAAARRRRRARTPSAICRATSGCTAPCAVEQCRVHPQQGVLHVGRVRDDAAAHGWRTRRAPRRATTTTRPPGERLGDVPIVQPVRVEPLEQSSSRSPADGSVVESRHPSRGAPPAARAAHLGDDVVDAARDREDAPRSSS